ncbi:MAG: sel1 repeat family protein [Deltaproteobacteria bacterium]|nr:sel1 repeat family protein [Deltaproteobacteria bacterium]
MLQRIFVVLLAACLWTGLGEARQIGRYKSLTASVPDNFECAEKIKLTITAPDASYFKGDRIAFQWLVGSARAALGFDCERIQSILINGRVGNKQVYQGISASSGNWVVVDIALKKTDVARTTPQQPTKPVKIIKSKEKAAPTGTSDAEAQFKLGLKYERGKGVPKNPKKAVEFYRKAAEQGHADAQAMLGSMYDSGSGVPQDISEAARWYRLSAENGSRGGQFMYGTLLGSGRGVPKDQKQAVVWYRKSAEQGLAGAQYNLAICYAQGRGVQKDDQEAAKWFLKAAFFR